METIIELTSASGTERWPVRGQGRVSNVKRLPGSLGVPQDGFADLWLWLEPDVQIALAPDSELQLCPGSPCVELISTAVDRGLPATVRVHGPVNGHASLALSTCGHPACRLEVPLQATTGCGPLVFAAAPIGQDSLRMLTCPGARVATSGHPELMVVDSSTAAVRVRWSPSAPGPFEAELTRGGQSHVVRGYAVEAAVCRAEVGPAPVVFGAVQLGGFREEEISVRALGPEPCLLSGADTDSPDFTVQISSPHWIAPGEQSALQVRLSPRARGPRVGQVRMWLSDGSNGPHIELAGRGVTSDLELLTETLDFGQIDTCTRHSLPIRILNRGSVPGAISEARISGQPSEVLQVSWPRQVPAAQLFSVPVLLSPNFSGSLQATVSLQLEGTREQTSYEVPVTASVSPKFGAIRDEFMQLALPKSDVVFAIDPVGPSSPALAHMQPNLRAFARFAAAQAVDINLMVVSGARSSTTSAGFEARPGTQRSVFAGDDPDFEQAFVDTALAVARRAAGPNSTIANLHTAVTSSTAAAVLRPEVWLSMIGVSLREDESEEAVPTWLNRFTQLKGDRYSYDAVVGDVPDGCDRDGAVQWTYHSATNSITFTLFATPEYASTIAVKYRRMCP